MTSAQVQTWAQKRTTWLLIQSEPTLVALRRAGTWVSTPSGGQKRSGALQTFSARERFFSIADPNQRFSTTIDGVLIQGDHILVGMPDDDMKSMDEFSLGHKKFQILFVHSNRDFECRAECKQLTQASG